VLNAVCFSMANFLLLWLLSDHKRRLSNLHLATYLYLTFLQTLAMAVVNPYDQLAYLLILTSFFAVTIPPRWIAYVLLSVAAIAGTLTRETQFLVTPALFSAALFSAPEQAKRLGKAGFYNLALFSLTYVGLRVFLRGPKLIAQAWTYGGTWGPESFFVLAMLFLVSTSLALRMVPDIRPTVVLLVLSAPYLLTILTSGVLRELRLLVPILLAQAFVYVALEATNKAAQPLLEGIGSGIRDARAEL
jgi:hypothetical protein